MTVSKEFCYDVSDYLLVTDSCDANGCVRAPATYHCVPWRLAGVMRRIDKHLDVLKEHGDVVFHGSYCLITKGKAWLSYTVTFDDKRTLDVCKIKEPDAWTFLRNGIELYGRYEQHMRRYSDPGTTGISHNPPQEFE